MTGKTRNVFQHSTTTQFTLQFSQISNQNAWRMLPRVSRQYTPIAGKGKSVVRVTRLRHIRVSFFWETSLKSSSRLLPVCVLLIIPNVRITQLRAQALLQVNQLHSFTPHRKRRVVSFAEHYFSQLLSLPDSMLEVHSWRSITSDITTSSRKAYHLAKR